MSAIDPAHAGRWREAFFKCVGSDAVAALRARFTTVRKLKNGFALAAERFVLNQI